MRPVAGGSPARPVRLPRAARAVLSRARPAAAVLARRPRLRPPVGARPLRHHRHPPGPLPRLPDRAARPADAATSRSRSRSAAPTRKSPSPMCWTARPTWRLADVGSRRDRPPLPDHRAGLHRRRDRRRLCGAPARRRPRPLALFDGLRTDFSLARLAHYTGAPAEHVQQYILFTNYHRYVDEFVRWGCEQLQDRRSATRRCRLRRRRGGRPPRPPIPERVVADGAWRKHQMPAYHLMRPRAGRGSRLVNIGVGPSNAKTISDHLAVLRPAGLADDRPLRRPARPARPSATMSWPTPICATTTCWTRCCRRRSRSRRSPRCRWR